MGFRKFWFQNSMNTAETTVISASSLLQRGQNAGSQEAGLFSMAECMKV